MFSHGLERRVVVPAWLPFLTGCQPGRGGGDFHRSHPPENLDRSLVAEDRGTDPPARIGAGSGRTVRLDQVLRLILSAVVHPGGLGFGSAGLFLVHEERKILRGRLARPIPSPELLPRREDLGQELEALASGPSSSSDRSLEAMVRRFSVPLEQLDHPLVAALSCTWPVVDKPGEPIAVHRSSPGGPAMTVRRC